MADEKKTEDRLEALEKDLLNVKKSVVELQLKLGLKEEEKKARKKTQKEFLVAALPLLSIIYLGYRILMAILR